MYLLQAIWPHFVDSNVLCGQASHTANIIQQTEGYLARSETEKTEECAELKDLPRLNHLVSAVLPHQARYTHFIVSQELLGLAGLPSPSVTLTPCPVVNVSNHQNAFASVFLCDQVVSLQLAVFRFQHQQHRFYPETECFNPTPLICIFGPRF